MITPRELTSHKIFDLSTLDNAIKIGYEAACNLFEAIEKSKKL